MTHTDLPEINLKEHEEWKQQNFKDRLAFIDWYVDWLKKQGKIIYK